MIKIGRAGKYRGKEYIFTHRDPDTERVWSDDIDNGKNAPPGRWVNPEEVKWNERNLYKGLEAAEIWTTAEDVCRV